MSTHKLPLPAFGGADTCAGNARPNAPNGSTFLDAMLDMSPTSGPSTQNPMKMAASVLIHGLVIAALVIVPVWFAKNTLVLKTLTPTYVFAPPPPAPPPPAAAKAVVKPAITPQIKTPTYEAPKVIPKDVPAAAAPEAAPDVADNTLGGVPGGVPGGVLGGVLGGTGTAPGPPPPPQQVVRVGGNVKAPALINKVEPQYPSVARVAHVQGTVVISAVIDKTGNVVSEKVVSGPELLAKAALDAVKQWKYQPTVLNGQPVDLAMEVTVNFELAQG